MCTVSIFYKGNNDFVLTSNRDEAPNRNALEPTFYSINDTQLLMPKDEQSGGSWIGTSAKNRVVCLLNGGFEIHKRKLKYRHSRGIVVTDFLITNDVETTSNLYDFNDLEPFTLVIADWNTSLKFYELVWDGKQKHFKQLALETKIWSSSTLYTKKNREEREKWFHDFRSTTQLNSNTILEFHKTAGKGNSDYGVIMDRGFVKTTSITQIEKSKDLVEMEFLNLKTLKKTRATFNLSETVNE